MSEKITVPTLGESVTEATVSKWLKSQGEKVVADEPIVELETDKVNVEVPAPSNGVLGDIKVREGETVNVGSILGIIKYGSSEDIKEVKSYTPPKKQPEIFDKKKNEVKRKSHKLQKDEQVLKLDSVKEEDEPLILEQVHEEKKVVKNTVKIKDEKKVSPAARKWPVKQRLI